MMAPIATEEAGWPWPQLAGITRDIIAVMMIARITVCLKKERAFHELHASSWSLRSIRIPP
jgi:hypothetical protein